MESNLLKQPEHITSLATGGILLRAKVKVWTATKQDRDISDEVTANKKAALAAKIDYAVETCLEAEKYICFTWMKQDAIKLHGKLVEEDSPCELITGDLSQKQREAAIERAIRLGHSVVATIDSCGVGVDRLQYVSNNVIFHAIDPTPTKTAQAEARAHRIGQESPVFVTFLALADSADELIVERVVEKLQAWTDTMGRDATAKMKDVIDTRPDTDMEDLANLFAEE